MKLSGFYINGFGLFHDIKVEDLSPELTLFLGDNESGKSTLLGFIRSILFGFPDGRSNENPYPPLFGGRHGGNLVIDNDQLEKYVLERYAGAGGGKVKIIGSGRIGGGRETLGSILGNTDRTLFKNIFAFSLTELQDFETLNSESVEETLYSAGAGINPNNLLKFKSVLDKSEKDLFKPGGRRPKINKILIRLMSIQKEKKALQGCVEDFDRIHSQIAQSIERIDSLEKDRISLTIEIRKNEQWMNILPEWINLTLSRDKLSSLDIVESFPSQGIARLEGFEDQLNYLQKDLLKKDEELKTREDELGQLKVDPELLSRIASIRQLQKGMGRFESLVREVLALGQELLAGEQRLRQRLCRLGISWNEEKLLAFNLSVATGEEVRRFRERLQQTKAEVQRKKDVLDMIMNRKSEVEGSIQIIAEPEEKDPDILNGRKKDCRKMRRHLSEMDLLEYDLDHIDERLKDLKEESLALEEGGSSGIYQLPFSLIPLIVLVGLIFLILLGLFDLWNRGISIMGLSIILGALLYVIRSKMIGVDRKRQREIERNRQRLALKMEGLETKRSDKLKRIEESREAIDQIYSRLNISGEYSVEILERKEQEISEIIRQLADWNGAKNALEQVKKQFREAQEDYKYAGTVYDSCIKDWEKWLEEYELDRALSPEGAFETLGIIQYCREQMENINQLRLREASLEAEKREYIEMVSDVMDACNRGSFVEGEILVAVQGLIRDLSDTEQAAQKRDLLLREINVYRDSKEQTAMQIKDLQKKVRKLIASGGADNEEQFRKRGEIFEKRTKLMMDIERYEDSIKRLSRKLEKPDKVMNEIAGIDPEKLEERRAEMERDLKDTEVSLDRLKREKARLEEEIRHLVGDERISKLRVEEEDLRSELELLSEEWVTIRLAKWLMRMARSRYEKERQPEVIFKAGNFFKRMTLGEYSSIVSPLGENRIEVVSRDSSRKGIGQLSRGTAEQLYLSIRFGFIREFSMRSNSLPVIMDDILVNFDNRRAKETIKGIIQLAEENQVLFFTCHPDTAGLFRDEKVEIPIFEIYDRKIRKWKD